MYKAADSNKVKVKFEKLKTGEMKFSNLKIETEIAEHLDSIYDQFHIIPEMHKI